jgi:hypothetical protein
VDRVEGPATVDDSSRFLRVVAGAGDELQPVNDKFKHFNSRKVPAFESLYIIVFLL